MEPLNNSITQINKPEQRRKSFIEANTVPCTLEQIRSDHIIPVFKDGTPVISTTDFVEASFEGLSNYYSQELISAPELRLSHPVEARVASARNKTVDELLPEDKTIFYDRAAFCIEIPSISDDVGGNPLSLTFGGVAAYSQTNLTSAKNSPQYFTIFMGYRNSVCCNLKVSSDGVISNLKVHSINELKASIKTLIENYNAVYHLNSMRKLVDYNLTETQFAQVLGRCRMYHHLPQLARKHIPELLINDTQLSLVVREFYHDKHFGRDGDGNINLWKLYNLFTGASKHSYIDHFLDRSVNAFEFVEGLKRSLEHHSESWFLN
jgi:hypothetical protein